MSEAFIDLLNQCNTNSEDAKELSIGKAFIQAEPEFRRVYSIYCINHDNAQFLLEKVTLSFTFPSSVRNIYFYFFIFGLQYETLPSINKVLEEGVALLKNQIVCFNMGSVIIKPVQRILKYPLILGELIKVLNPYGLQPLATCNL